MTICFDIEESKYETFLTNCSNNKVKIRIVDPNENCDSITNLHN